MKDTLIPSFGKNVDINGTEQDIRKQVHELGLDDAVDFAGSVSNVNEFLMGMDVFVFPSFQEGLSIAFLEAQTSGLPCIISSGIRDGILSDRVRQCALSADIAQWVETVEEASLIRDHREIYPKIVADAGFDVKSTAKELQEFYLSVTPNT